MQPAPSPSDHRQRVLAPARKQHHSERRQLLHLNDVTTSSPPVRIQAPCVYRKIATRLKRDGAGRPQPSDKTEAFRANTARKASGGIGLPSSASTPAPPPFKFHLG